MRLEAVADVVWGRDEPMSTEGFRDELLGADAVIFGEWRHGPLDPEVDGPNLVALLEVAGGHQHSELGYERALAAGTLVGSCAPAFVPAVAEMGLALALASMRGVVRADRQMRRRSERWLHAGNAANTSLIGATVGFVGCGGIATRLRALLEPFDVTAIGFDPPLAGDEVRRRGFEPASLDDIIERSDLIFVLAAPTRDNERLLDAQIIGRLTPRQHIVVLSRSSVLDTDALLDLVAAGRTQAALDVYDIEPLPAAHRARDLEGVILSPHLAGALPVALEDIGNAVVDDLVDIFAGRTPGRLQYLHPDNASGLVQHNRNRSTQGVPPWQESNSTR